MSTSEIAATEIQGLEYVVLGLATCYQRDAEGRLVEVQVIEPIPASELDSLATQGRTTSYSLLYATTYAAVVDGEKITLPSEPFPDSAQVGNYFLQRIQAAIRSYRTKTSYKHVPLYQTCTPTAGPFVLNYHPEPKRILGDKTSVKESDNVKQHAHTHKEL
ncbi:MAG: hypothetical protein OHK0012_08270 [Synechococcales cyanobacterium]